MSNYGVFAKYYDRLLSNGEYEVRSDYISGFFIANGIKSGRLLDIGCGTGEFSRLFFEKGFEVTGLDISEDMLTVAKSKCMQANFIKSDMRSFNFNNMFDCCISCLDSINHLNSKEDWKSCFESVAASLKKDGLFVFDINTPYKHNCVLAGNSFIFDEEDFFLAWDNVGEENNTVDIYLDFFVYNGTNYDRYSENFKEIAFDSKTVTDLLKDSFNVLGVYDELTHNDEKETSERLYFVCKRK